MTLYNAPIILLLLITSFAKAQQASDELVIRKTNNFDISGDGSASAWKTTEWITLEKRKGVARYATRAKLLYADEGIYALFSCEDDKITSTLKEDFANLWTEDVVEIFFWPDEGSTIYFEYELSPHNYELPILVPNMKGDFLGWRPWQYEGARKTRHATNIVKNNNGETTAWIAEFFIPFALLKPLQNVPPKPGDIGLIAFAVWKLVKSQQTTQAIVFAVAGGLFLAWFLATDSVPREFTGMTPYIATLLVLAFASQRLRMPKADGQVYRKGSAG